MLYVTTRQRRSVFFAAAHDIVVDASPRLL
jgi:hypothetical protein